MQEILQWVPMVTLLPGLVLTLIARRYRTDFARSLSWHSRKLWWWPRPKIDTLLTPRGVTLSRVGTPLIYIGVTAYAITSWIL